VKGRRRISARRQRLIENSFPHVDLFRRRRFAGAASTLYLRFFEPMAAERLDQRVAPAARRPDLRYRSSVNLLVIRGTEPSRSHRRQWNRHDECAPAAGPRAPGVDPSVV
jgi:hypothetical protein